MTYSSDSISVIIPVYIGIDALTFKRSMESLLSQTRQPQELVVVIDGPIKEELWAYFLETLSWDNLGFPIKLVCCLRNEGPGYARTLAASIASSNWLAIHDADDVYVRSRLEAQAHYFSDEVDVIGAYIEESHDYGDKAIVNKRSVPLLDRDVKRFMNSYSPVNNGTAIIRKDIFFKAGGYPSIRFGEDYILWQRIRKVEGKFLNIAEVVATVSVDKEFFSRRRGTSLLRREFEYLNLMLEEGHMNYFTYLYKIARSMILRLIPLPVSRTLYRTYRK